MGVWALGLGFTGRVWGFGALGLAFGWYLRLLVSVWGSGLLTPSEFGISGVRSSGL